MADNKIIICPDKVFGLLAFTAIAALALIICGIALFSFPTEMSEIEVVKQNYTIEYTHCKYAADSYDTCEDVFENDTKKNLCQCFLETNLTESLHGEVFVHCVLEISDQQGSKIDHTSVKTFTDEISNTSGQCDPYNTQETANETCEVIPDSIFNDEFTLYINYTVYNSTAKEVDKNMLSLKKTVRWSLDDNNSTTGLQNKITVSMNTTKDLAARSYLLFINFYRNENIVRRYLILSTQNHVVRIAYSRSRVMEIIALVLGLVLAVASIALIAIRNRIAGVKSNTMTVVTADDPTANNRLSGTRPEERPLAAHVNNEQS